MWRIEKTKRIGIKPWYWVWANTAYGYADGVSWTKRGAENALLRAQTWFFTEDRP